MPKTMKNRNSKQQNKKNKQKPKQQKTRNSLMSPGVGISHCALKYALAISDPWNPEARGACVPRTPSRPSQKVTAFKRLTVTIGTGGFGGIQFAPCLANDLISFFHTTAAHTSTFPATLSSATTGVATGSLDQLPYASTSLIPVSATVGPAVAGRIVSASVSWQYTGTVSNMGGVAYALCHPDHNNMNSIAGDIFTYAETEVIRNDSRRHWVGINGIDEEETSYTEGHSPGHTPHVALAICYPFSNREPNNGVDTTVGGSPVCIYFSGVAGNTFEVEMIVHAEYIGKTTQSYLTPSHSDAVGFEVVQNAAARLPMMLQQTPNVERKTLMSKALQMVGRELAPVVRLGAQNLVATGARALAGAAMGYITSGGNPAGAMYGGALGVSSGSLRLTNG